MLHRGDQVGPYYVVGCYEQGPLGGRFKVEHGLAGMYHTLLVLPLPFSDMPLAIKRMVGLRHQNIVSVVGMLDVDGQLGLLTDSFLGVPLRLSVGKLSAESALEVMRDVLSGVSAAHNAGVLHLDLNLDNILVGKDHLGRIVAKVQCFSLLREVLSASGESSLHNVASRFSAPEMVINANSADARSDVFSSAAILYELLSGTPAFEGSQISMAKSKARGQYPPLSDTTQQMLPHITNALERALLPKLSQRYTTAALFSAALYRGAVQVSSNTRDLSDLVITEIAGTPEGQDPKRYSGITDAKRQEIEKLTNIENPIPVWVLLAAVLMIVVVLTFGIGTYGVSAVDSTAASVGTSGDEVIEMFSQHHELVRELAGLGVNPIPLQRAYDEYDRDKSSTKVVRAWALHKEMLHRITRSPASVTDDQVALKHRISTKLRGCDVVFYRWAVTVLAWDQSAKTPFARPAVWLGVGDTPLPQQIEAAREIVRAATD